MAYMNPKTNNIYLTMKLAPICNLSDYDLNRTNDFICDTCPVMRIAKSHGHENLSCQAVCELYDNEVASAFGYVDVEKNPTTGNYVPSNFMRVSER